MIITSIESNSEWRALTRYSITIPGYYVNRCGDIYTTFRNKFKSWRYKYSKRGRLDECNFTVVISPELFEDFDHVRSKGGTKSVMNITVHKAVMEAWKPVDQYPPEALKEVWNTLPEEAKQWVRDTVVIDHIDGDPSNNNIDNLRYVTPKENNVHRKASL
jgi:hypothetical protein